MKLQYRIGKLELDNMELEQSRIVHESAMRGKDLTIQKLQLQVVCFGLTCLKYSIVVQIGFTVELRFFFGSTVQHTLDLRRSVEVDNDRWNILQVTALDGQGALPNIERKHHS